MINTNSFNSSNAGEKYNFEHNVLKLKFLVWISRNKLKSKLKSNVLLEF